MSSIVIEVPEDLETVLIDDLIRIEEADGRHAIEHKRANNPDPCDECRAYIRAMRQIIETRRLSPQGQAIEMTAIALYRHEVGFKDFADAARMWEYARMDQRERARSRAREVINLIDAPFPIYRSED
jgi:hypothetical protein